MIVILKNVIMNLKKEKNKKDVWFAMTNKITNDYKNGINHKMNI